MHAVIYDGPHKIRVVFRQSKNEELRMWRSHIWPANFGDGLKLCARVGAVSIRILRLTGRWVRVRVKGRVRRYKACLNHKVWVKKKQRSMSSRPTSKVFFFLKGFKASVYPFRRLNAWTRATREGSVSLFGAQLPGHTPPKRYTLSMSNDRTHVVFYTGE